MCTPVLTAVGTAVSAMGSMQQAKAQTSAYSQQAQIADNNAKINEAQAANAAENGAKEEQAIHNKGNAYMGAQTAGFGASGLDTSSGSPLDVLNDTSYQNTMDALAARRNAANQSWGYQAEATNNRQMANEYRGAASNAMTAGKLNTFATILNGSTTLSKQLSARKMVGLGQTTALSSRGGISGIPGQYP